MKVILLEDVKSLGKKGQLVDVSDGYARNFILAKKLGLEATSKNMNDLKLQKAHEDKLAAERLAEAKAFAEDENIGLPRQLPLKVFQKWLGKCKAKALETQEKKIAITIKQ